MGINLVQSSESWGVDDKSWLGTKLGMDQCRTITLNLALFNAEHYAEGFIKSGIVLGKVTATGLYGPYSPLLSNGLEVALGHLFDAVMMSRDGLPITTGSAGAALFWMGVVRTTKLPAYTGTGNLLGELDAAARTALSNFIRYEDN